MAVTPSSEKITRLATHARALGCSDIIPLDIAPNVSHLEYLDLLPKKSQAVLLPDAVAEFQGRPLLYLVDDLDEAGNSRFHANDVTNLQTLLANRSEHACLGVAKPGSLEVYPINLNRKILAEASFKTILISEPDAPTFFQSLATGTFDLRGRPRQADYVYEIIYELLTKASQDLAGTEGKPGPLHGLDVLSTTGRALFFRFLIDRRIVLDSELAEISPGANDLKDAFSSPEKAAATSCWLDETFNGDLLPLVDELSSETTPEQRLRAYRRFFRSAGDATGQKLFSHLQAILRGWKNVGGASFQLTFDWNDFDFAHIPIGVLSQVYESFSQQWDEEHAQETSVYYTPRHLAKLLVEEAFAAMTDSSNAVVLDPACGAGVFLVLAFRQLVRRNWQKNGSRPDTRTIQRILYKQLRGFEVSESALRLSALALYISAIELNGTQRPPKSLRFPLPLRNEVLFNFGRQEAGPKRGFEIGSLGPDVPLSFNKHFDIVVTNPPWTRLRASSENAKDKAREMARAAEINTAFTALTQHALVAKGLDNLAVDYINPDNNPDLPFLWRATEWVKSDGIIAIALPGRVILRQSGKGKAARDTILRGLTVTGILNGSDLEKTPVWPNMDLPFILLFARNSVPSPNYHFHFATPIRDSRLSSHGQFRLDYRAAETVNVEDVVKTPWLLKALAVGSILDFEVVEKIQQRIQTKLGDFWCPPVLESGVGYKLASKLKQHPADDLFKLLEFAPPRSGFQIEFTSLKKWQDRHDRETVHSTGKSDLYRPPLLIIPQTPGQGREGPKSFLSLRTAMCFSQSYYGYSSHGRADGDLLICTLYLLTHSSLFQHFCLAHSSRIGASYRTIIKEDLDAFPFPDPNQISSARKDRILKLAEELESSAKKPWNEIDGLIFELYGLDEYDTTVIHDTVTFGGPYRSVREPAEEPAGSADTEAFRKYLEDMLQPLFLLTGQQVTVKVEPLDGSQWHQPWRFLSVSIAGDQLPNFQRLLVRLMADANMTGASRIVLHIPQGGLIVGILNQRKFWTRSRARLCSLHIEQHHLNAFPIPTP